MTQRRRSIEVFTLSFLDCICCGFGAVILFYTIVSARSGIVQTHSTDTLTAEVNRLDEQVLTGTRNLAALKRELEFDAILPVSAKTGYGIAELWGKIAEAGNAGLRD